MTIFQAVSRLIDQFGIMETPEKATLEQDIKAYESEVMGTKEPENLPWDKKIYRRLHNGIYIRMVMPFIWLGMVRWARNILSPSNGEDELLKD